MSQEKVDRYKKEKANREKIMRRERWITRLEVTAFVVVLATLIGWFSVAVYQNSVAEKKANRTKETTTMNVTDIQNYLSETNTVAEMLFFCWMYMSKLEVMPLVRYSMMPRILSQ